MTRNGHSTLKEQHAAHEVDKEKKEQLMAAVSGPQAR